MAFIPVAEVDFLAKPDDFGKVEVIAPDGFELTEPLRINKAIRQRLGRWRQNRLFLRVNLRLQEADNVVMKRHQDTFEKGSAVVVKAIATHS